MNKTVAPASLLEGELFLPADKSISHRSVMFGALHQGVSHISNFSSAADPQSTVSCLRQLGVEIEQKEDQITIQGVGRDGFKPSPKDLDCGNSGTTMRLLSGIVGGAGITCRLVGDESLSTRTMKRIVDPLRQMGIDIEARQGDYAPLKIRRSGKITPLSYSLPIPSAQLKSSVLLAGLFGDNPTRVIETIESRDHTERLLDLPVDEKKYMKVISSDRSHAIPPQNYTIPNDFSAAAFWLVAASIHPEASIRMPAVGINPTRTAALSILEKMGADINIRNRCFEGPEPVADLEVSSSVLTPVNIGEEIVPNCIDEIPVLAIAMLFADGVSEISGAGELRHKETDRLAALTEMLEAAGADFSVREDGLEIRGNPGFQPRSATFKSYHDHRIAMAGAVLSLMGSSASEVQNADCTAISYPSFWDDLSKLTN